MNTNTKDSFSYNTTQVFVHVVNFMESKQISNDQVLIQLDPMSCPQNQKANN